jgi:hypothetical protein
MPQRENKRYVLRSCSRNISKGYKPIDALKNDENRRLGSSGSSGSLKSTENRELADLDAEL